MDHHLVRPTSTSIAPVAAATSPVLVVATVDGKGPHLRGVDWIRVDGAHGTLRALSGRREGWPQPVLFDVPGAGTRRRGTLLTRSEFLVFAAAEGFEWVNLRGVREPEEVIRAREFLPSSARLSVTLDTQRTIRRELDAMCAIADAVLLDRRALRHALGGKRADALIGAAVRHATERETPTLLATDVLPSMHRDEQPGHRDMARLTDLVDDGLRGLVLTTEVTATRDPQERVDVARLIAQQGGVGPFVRHEVRPAARVSGRMRVVTVDAEDGIVVRA